MPNLSSSPESFSATIPPTSYLPPIKSLLYFTETQRLHECLAYLRQIYVPNVRGSRRRKPILQNSYNLHLPSSSSSFTTIRKDPFERAYALRWLSALTRLQLLQPNSSDLSDLSNSPELAEIQNAAAALLAICAGTASAGTVQRQFEFDNGRIRIALNDVPLSTNASNGDYFGSVGAQTWGGACVLAEEIADHPYTFFPRPAESAIPERTFRILELGAGTGLVSLAAGKAATLNCPHHKMEIIATDYYPSVLDNLKANIKVNFPNSSPSLTISSQHLDWFSFYSPDANSDADASFLSTDIGVFDLILGADIIYEPLHASWIRSVVSTTLRKPSLTTEKGCPKGQGGLFHLIIPLRPSFSVESSTIEQEFVFVQSDLDRAGLGTNEREDNLVIVSKEIILCEADEDEEVDNVVRYAYYVIGWKT